MRTRLVVLMAVALAVVAAPAVSADERSDEEGRLQAIYDDSMAGSVGGTGGFYLKAVGGPVLLDSNETYVHDPASAIKVLGHLHAMREVQAGRDDLWGSFTSFRYPSSRNSGGDPSSPNLCPAAEDEVQANRETEPLQFGLAKMMQVSDNRATRGVVLRYGLPALNALAKSLGMSQTKWDQDLVGCGYEGDKRNALTPVDIGKLYEAVASGRVLDSKRTGEFWSLMASQPVRRGDHLLEIIQDEARKLGKPAAIGPVAERLVRRFKGGSYNICGDLLCVTHLVIREIDGVASIPFKVGGAVQMRDFVFSSFIADAQAVCLEYPCPKADEIQAGMYLGADELLRSVIRSALQTW
ncbi:MAG TPA: serine hydrolase [Acidimicrobiales bacterium]|nr:serine hydrolase [Acidimicrobiales bacterium]